MNPSKNSDLSDTVFFEKSFFGLEITAPVKESLYRGLKIGSDESVLTNTNICLNEDLSEMILTDKDFGKIEAIVLSNENSRKISAKMVEGNRTINGTIYPSSSPEAMGFLRLIAAEIRFINYMIHEIGGPRVDDIPNFPKLEGLAEPLTLNRVRDKIGNHFYETYQKAKIGSILNCLKSRACFLFK